MTKGVSMLRMGLMDCIWVSLVLVLFGFAGCSGKVSGTDAGFDAADGETVADDGSGGDDGGIAEADADGGGDADGQTLPDQDGDQDEPPDGWRYFPAGAFMYLDYSDAPLHADSGAIIAALASAGGWGQDNQMQIDFSIEVLHDLDGTAPLRDFIATGEHYSPDCDLDPMPVPLAGALEGENAYECTSDGDCHLIVVRHASQTLHEMWRANIEGGDFYGGCLAVWDMTRVYGPLGRGEQCTSADAAGFPIAPLLFSADEVAAGEIAHAIRFILPNDRVRARRYVRPATHGTNTTGGAMAPPYGVHFRLKAGVDISGLNPGAQVVARALKKYGMFHADGGNIALTAQSDRFTEAKWDGLLGPRDLFALKVSDFEVIDHGGTIEVTYDCVREP